MTGFEIKGVYHTNSYHFCELDSMTFNRGDLSVTTREFVDQQVPVDVIPRDNLEEFNIYILRSCL
jgi:hypothetical protein